MASHSLTGRMIVTGGAGFIGTNFIRRILNLGHELDICVMDRSSDFSYLSNTDGVANSARLTFNKVDLCNFKKVNDIIRDFKPNFIVNFAAVSHVDTTIDEPVSCALNNIESTLSILEASRHYWITNGKPEKFVHLQVSTDEVYGSLDNSDTAFSETHAYNPNSPYSASKAATDHLTNAWKTTYGLPTIITCCSNNYGPFQHPEKFIPLVILNALETKPLPLYGDGSQVRDWLHVYDHVDGILAALIKGKAGETYNFGGDCELTNEELLNQICSYLDTIRPTKHSPNASKLSSYSDLIINVEDRPGHDQRYAINFSKARAQLDWKPKQNFYKCLPDTIEWYVQNTEWVNSFGANARARQGLIKK